MLEIVWAFIRGARNIFIPIGTGILGFFIGLVVFGWWLTPVEWTGAGPQDLIGSAQQKFIENAAIAYSSNGDAQRVTDAFNSWTNSEEKRDLLFTNLCQPSWQSPYANLFAPMALALGTDCTTYQVPVVDEGSSWMTCLLGLLLIVVVGAAGALAYMRFMSSGDIGSFDFKPNKPVVVPDAPPTSDTGDSMEGFVPIASYRTSFSIGQDAFDDSFAIENANGDFLGECGVGISESIGSGSPRKITAFEVWLFDKSDIRTITKIGLSDHAYNNDVIRAKLQSKGDAVLAGDGEVIALETKDLIINAKISGLQYGDDPGLPQNSYFNHFTIELSAWAKEGAGGGGDGMDFNDF